VEACKQALVLKRSFFPDEDRQPLSDAIQ